MWFLSLIYTSCYMDNLFLFSLELQLTHNTVHILEVYILLNFDLGIHS